MTIDPGAGEICLNATHLLKLRDAEGVVVRCTKGALWITVTGVREDRCLLQGDAYRIPGGGLTLIEGSERSCLYLERGERHFPGPLALPRRIVRQLGKNFLSRIARAISRTGRAASGPDCRA